MPDYSHRSDRELLSLLAAIESDPASYVPAARPEVLSVLESRYPKSSPQEIALAIEAREREDDARNAWIESTTQALAQGVFTIPSGAPDPGALRAALASAVRASTLAVLREAALFIALPALFVLGLVHLSNPESLWLAPFRAARHIPYAHYISGLPGAMALLLETPFRFLPPTQAAALLAILFGLFGLAALSHVVRRLKVLASIRALSRAVSHGAPGPATNERSIGPR